MTMATTKSEEAIQAELVELAEESHSCECAATEDGFTLLETTIALVVMMIAALGAASLFSFSINYNSGASDRAVCLALGQEKLEKIRSAQFNSTTTDEMLTGGTWTQSGLIRNGKRYTLTTTIDDDPAMDDVQVNSSTTLKGITVAVVPEGASSTAGATITLITQRARTDR